MINRKGEKSVNNEGYLMEIIEYKNAHDMIIQFLDNHKAIIRCKKYNDFKYGKIKNPYHPKVFNIGFIGQGNYKSRENKQLENSYRLWENMLQRCYDPYYINKHPTYKDCAVCEEWHNFQNFAKWYEENYYEVKDEIMCLDKDILIKGNEIYSPSTCIFVPKRINLLFVKNDLVRGEYPIGVCLNKNRQRLLSGCNVLINNKKKHINLGYFNINEPFKAFTCYKIFKEKYIKEVADEYKDLIPIKLYEALYKYEVEIND